MSRSEEFVKGLASGGNRCANCGTSIDLSKAHSTGGVISDVAGESHTDHFDIDGGLIAKHYTDEHNERGMQCPACIDKVESKKLDKARAGLRKDLRASRLSLGG